MPLNSWDGEHPLTSLHIQPAQPGKREEALPQHDTCCDRDRHPSKSCFPWLAVRETRTFLKLPRLLLQGFAARAALQHVKPWCPHPNTLPGQAIRPTQPTKCNPSSIIETLQASINKHGASPSPAHSPGKATAAKALTWRFTQTLSRLAIKHQQNITLLLLSVYFTSPL